MGTNQSSDLKFFDIARGTQNPTFYGNHYLQPSNGASDIQSYFRNGATDKVSFVYDDSATLFTIKNEALGDITLDADVNVTGNLDVTGSGTFGANGRVFTSEPSGLGRLSLQNATDTDEFHITSTQGIYQQNSSLHLQKFSNQNVEVGASSIADLIVHNDLDVTGSVITGSFSSAPSSPSAGQIYFNTTTNKHQGYDGTSWNNLY
jgi:hypothetical protein